MQSLCWLCSEAQGAADIGNGSKGARRQHAACDLAELTSRTTALGWHACTSRKSLWWFNGAGGPAKPSVYHSKGWGEILHLPHPQGNPPAGLGPT